MILIKIVQNFRVSPCH